MRTSIRLQRGWLRGLVVAVLLAALLVALVAWLNVRGEEPLPQADAGALAATPAVFERGAYLARAGNCVGCHTAAGGAPLAGGKGVKTPFGTVYSPNITSDAQTGIGAWSAAEFWRAMHHGRSKDGRLLYPAFPYPSFTTLSREDADTLFVYLQNTRPVQRASTPHTLGFPYNTQAALAVWRAVFFRPGAFTPQAEQSPEWNRGKYLVQGLGHCAACHSGRNFLGATRLNAEFAGGLMPNEAWYAPSLASPKEAGVQGWPRDEVIGLLKKGVSSHASVAGPMAEVVYSSTQFLSEQDLAAMALFLASVPMNDPKAEGFDAPPSEVLTRGDKLYEQHCASCHGDQGQGVPSIYPALAGNRAVTLALPNNLVQTMRHGGFAPTTPGNPQPFGMPPFGQVLDSNDIAALATFIRQSWGNNAPPVTPLQVLRVK